MRYYKPILMLVFVLLGYMAISTISLADAPKATVSSTSAVKVLVDDGHGSGVNIGNGYIITAGHVAGDNKTVKVETKEGQQIDADVLWVNTTYDIAMLRVDPGKVGGGAVLDCRSAKTGEEIYATGNPLALDFVTSYGRIAGDERSLGPWKSALITDITTVPGQSGGPVFELDGRIIGITVGVVTSPLGISASFTGFGTVVPSSTVCMLLGQSA